MKRAGHIEHIYSRRLEYFRKYCMIGNHSNVLIQGSMLVRLICRTRSQMKWLYIGVKAENKREV